MKCQLFAMTNIGLEPHLAEELRNLGGEDVWIGNGGVALRGAPSVIMNICLWSRLASRVLLPIAKAPTFDSSFFSTGILEIPWEKYMCSDSTFRVVFEGVNTTSCSIDEGIVRVNSTVEDRFRSKNRAPPKVNMEQPDLIIHVLLQEEQTQISLDLSRNTLPTQKMSKSLLSGILLLAGWPQIALLGGALANPMCGSGTLAIQAAKIAANVAPGLSTSLSGFQTLPWFDREAWEGLVADAQKKAEEGLKKVPPIFAWEDDSNLLTLAKKEVELAGFSDHIHFKPLSNNPMETIQSPTPGLVIFSSPKDKRCNQKLTKDLKTGFTGWQSAVFSDRSDCVIALGLLPTKEYDLHNESQACRLWVYEHSSTSALDLDSDSDSVSSGNETHFSNRLKKKLRQLGKWAKREGIECYRLYDADMPEYAVAIDLYGEWVHIQEYQAPKTVDPNKAKQRFDEVVDGVQLVLDTPLERIQIKVRKPQKGLNQYEKQGENNQFLTVSEGGLKFLVNLQDYLDSGLFLDHRLLREKIRTLAQGRRFLNLFGYTGSASVYANAGGARESVLVDISRTYLNWAQKNATLNGFVGWKYQYIQEDCFSWLEKENSRFDLIFLAPPTFSNSKRMQGDLDINRDYGKLLFLCKKVLTPGGVLLFSTHSKRFKLDPEHIPTSMICTEITSETMPRDFQRKKPFHRTWQLELC